MSCLSRGVLGVSLLFFSDLSVIGYDKGFSKIPRPILRARFSNEFAFRLHLIEALSLLYSQSAITDYARFELFSNGFLLILFSGNIRLTCVEVIY